MNLKGKLNSFLEGFASVLNVYPEPRMSYTERRIREMGLFDGDWDELSDDEKVELAIESDFKAVMGDFESAKKQMAFDNEDE